jgi:hypothetical protein
VVARLAATNPIEKIPILLFPLLHFVCVPPLALVLSTGLAQAQTVPTASVSAARAHVQAPPASYHFPNGEMLHYAVEWHFFTAGLASVHLEAAGSERKVLVEADSAGVVNLLYKVHDHFEAAFDSHTFCSQRVSKHTEEGSHKRDTDVRFDYTQGKSVLNEKNLKTGESKRVENDLPGCVTDVVTAAFYYLRSLPLVSGNVYDFPISDGGKTAEVRAQVEGTETVKTPAGNYETMRVVAEATTGTLKGRGRVWIWYTVEGHTPVQMRVKLSWGTLLFRLQKPETAAGR